MKVAEAISFFGGTQTSLAKHIGTTQPCIANWSRRGSIPLLQQMRIREISGGALEIDRKLARLLAPSKSTSALLWSKKPITYNLSISQT